MTRGQHGRRAHTGRRAPAWLWPVVTVVPLGLAVAILAHIFVFYHHSDTVGNRLRAGALARAANNEKSEAVRPSSPGSARAQAARGCSNRVRKGEANGVIQAPSIGLDAPVLQGTSDRVLSVAVGHDPASAWPGPSDTTVFNAHDVSWFSHIDHLAIGSSVQYVAPCRTYHYRVTSKRVVQSGSPIYNSRIGSVALVTCYPLNALFLTPKRYVVTADLTSVTTGGRTRAVPAAQVGSLPTAVPAQLAKAVSKRLTTTAPLGTLRLNGNPTVRWAQSLAPINASGSLLTLYFAALQTAEQGNQAAWSHMAPGVPWDSIKALSGSSVTGWPGAATPSVDVHGSAVTGGTVDATITTSTGATYRMTMASAVRHGRLTITHWTAQSP